MKANTPCGVGVQRKMRLLQPFCLITAASLPCLWATCPKTVSKTILFLDRLKAIPKLKGLSCGGDLRQDQKPGMAEMDDADFDMFLQGTGPGKSQV